MNKYIIIHFLTIMLFMIRISAHDINDYNSAFSEELYKLKFLKLEYEVIAENYSDGDMQVEEAILNNIITPKYVYLKKTKKRNNVVDFEYISNGKTEFIYFPNMKSSVVQNNGEFNLIDKFYYDYMIFIPVAFTKRTSLQKLNSLFEITKEINHKIEFQDNDSCTITIKKLVRPYAAKMYNIYTLKLKKEGVYWLPEEIFDEYLIESEDKPIKLDGNFKIKYNNYEKVAGIFLPKKVELWNYIMGGWIGNNEDGTPQIRKKKLIYHEKVILKSTSISENDMAKNIMKIPSDVYIYDRNANKRYKSTDLEVL